MPNLHLSTFAIDATVPIGHALCGGWIKPAESVTDPLRCLGVVLLGDEAPVVLCSVDWTGVCNDAHRSFRGQLAAAAHTTPERVAVHAVHQHNAPFADPAATALVKPHMGLPLPHGKLRVRTLLVNGDHDLSTPLAWARRQLALTPRGKLVVVPGAGHSVQLRAVSNVGRRAVARFLLGP